MPRSLAGSGPNLLIQIQLACVRTVSQYRVGRKRLSYPVNIFRIFFFLTKPGFKTWANSQNFKKICKMKTQVLNLFPLTSAKTFDFNIDFSFVFYSFITSGLILKTKVEFKTGGNWLNSLSLSKVLSLTDWHILIWPMSYSCWHLMVVVCYICMAV